MGVMAARAQKPLELILARNLLTSISTPAFLVDEHAALVFYNEAAGALLGRSFEDVGRMSPEEWTSTYGPFGDDGKPVAAGRSAHHPGGPQRPPRPCRVPDPLGERGGARDRVQRLPDRRLRGGIFRGDDLLLAAPGNGGEEARR